MDTAEHYNSLSKGCAERQTHRISYLEIPALPEPRVGQTILACGSEGQGNVLGAVPDSQFYFGPNTLETMEKKAIRLLQVDQFLLQNVLLWSLLLLFSELGHLCTDIKNTWNRTEESGNGLCSLGG